MNTAVYTPVPSVLPRRHLKMNLGKSLCPPPREEEEGGDEDEELPLPDVVLCSALSASILHGERVRERRRHKAALQTRGRDSLEQEEVEDMMEPLVQSLEGLLQTTVSLHPDPAREEEQPCVFHNKRRRTISSSSPATATKLSLLAAVVTNSNTLKKDSLAIEDTPEGVFNGLKTIFKNIFAN